MPAIPHIRYPRVSLRLVVPVRSRTPVKCLQKAKEAAALNAPQPRLAVKYRRLKPTGKLDCHLALVDDQYQFSHALA